MKKILITDAENLIGQALLKQWSETSEYIIYALSDNSIKFENKNIIIDKVNRNIIKEFKNYCYDIKPDIIINTYFYNDYLYAEKYKKKVWDANVEFTKNLGRLVTILENKLIGFSNYMVFDGLHKSYSEFDQQNPLNYLGKSLLAAENAAKMSQTDFSWFRLGFLIGYNYYTNNELNLLDYLNNNDIKVPDYDIQPVFADDVAVSVEKIIDNDINEFFNFAGDEIISTKDLYYKYAVFNDISFNKIKYYKEKKIPKKIELINIKAKTSLNAKFTSINDYFTNIKNNY